MKQAVTSTPAPHPAGEATPAAPSAPKEARFPGLNLALWVWLAGFGLLVAELVVQLFVSQVAHFFK